MAQQAGCGTAGGDIALDPDDGGDVGEPAGACQIVGGIEDGDDTAFVPVAGTLATLGRSEGCRGRGDVLDLLVQGWLVVFDLDDQGDTGCGCDLEEFF